MLDRIAVIATLAGLAVVVWLIWPRKRERRAKPTDDGRHGVDLDGHGWWKRRG